MRNKYSNLEIKVKILFWNLRNSLYNCIMNGKNITRTGSVKVNPVALKEAKILCTKLDVNLGDYVTNAIIVENMRVEKMLKSKQKVK